MFILHCHCFLFKLSKARSALMKKSSGQFFLDTLINRQIIKPISYHFNKLFSTHKKVSLTKNVNNVNEVALINTKQ